VGEECYAALELPFRARWASTYLLLEESGPLGITEIADALKLTHPAVIAITDEMRDAGIVSSARDRDDARRRAIALTTKGRSLSKKLHDLWSAMTQAQRRVFSDAGCDIVAVLDAVDDGLAARPIADEVLRRVRGPSARTKTRAVVAATALVLAVSLGAPPMVQAQRAVDARVRASLVEAIADSLIGGYIYEDKARVIADSLRAALHHGRFDDAHDAAALGIQLSDFLRRVSNDKHLSVGYTSGSPTSTSQPSLATPGTRAASGSVVAPVSDTHGIERYEILPGGPGGIGYIDIRGFSGDPAAVARLDSIMATFANVSALIVDVRQNLGGGPLVIRQLSTYLFDKPTHLVSTFARGMSAPQERWTLETVPGKRLTNVPVYILTSRRTFSAGESFTFGLKVTRRATLVGERTGGGGHFGRLIPLIEGYRMFLPVGRSYDPRTNKGWEAEGIEPDVEVPQDKALERALELARARIGTP
jgi:DNA-binding MarR family transcriptional regulator